MIIEPEELQKQLAEVSCLTDDLNKLTRRLSVTAQAAVQTGKDTSLAYAYNTLILRRLQKSIDMFGLILETLGSAPAQSTLSDNLLMLAPQSHLNSCVEPPQAV